MEPQEKYEAVSMKTLQDIYNEEEQLEALVDEILDDPELFTRLAKEYADRHKMIVPYVSFLDYGVNQLIRERSKAHNGWDD